MRSITIKQLESRIKNHRLAHILGFTSKRIHISSPQTFLNSEKQNCSNTKSEQNSTEKGPTN